ncbi:MAG: HpaII family restriction endonuclease [Alphaproteobacteria bacterium]
MLKYNKGEWSELYVLIKLLKQKNISIHNTSEYYTILRVYINMLEKVYIDLTGNNLKLNDLPLTISNAELDSAICNILNSIKTTDTTTFVIENIKELLEKLNIQKIKQGNSFEKSDLDLQIDSKLGALDFGMSIKSDLGSKSTLLNASKATNFIFKINNLKICKDVINSINSKSKVKERISLILKNSNGIEFIDLDNKTYKDNLLKIDTSLPSILANLLIKYNSSHGASLISEVSDEKDKLQIKKFLIATALSMVPTKEWNIFKNNMGMILVNNEGNVSCFDLFDQSELSKYLLANIKFETASTSRHDFGYVYEENGSSYIKLNLQLRFV